MLKYSLPTLSLLNLLDAFLFHFFFQEFGIGIEKNPLVSNLLQFDPSGTVFLVVKTAFSIVLFLYWLKAARIKIWIECLAWVGTAVYLGMFLHGIA